MAPPIAPFVRPVPQLTGGAALTVPVPALPSKSLYFPAAGGIQGIDATGAILPLSSGSGSLIPLVDDTDNLGSASFRWHDGFFGGTVYAPTVLAASTGNSDIIVGGAGTGAVNLISNVSLTAPSASSGTSVALTVTPGINTGQTASVEASDVILTLNRTVTFATGALTTQRAVVIAAPTYAFVGASTLSDAATLAISGPPVQGTNATITRTQSFWVQSGIARFDGPVNFSATATLTANPVINKAAGQVSVAIGAATCTVTNSLVTATSIVLCELQFIDATFTQILSVVPGAGSFVITGNAVATALTKIGFIVINPSP